MSVEFSLIFNLIVDRFGTDHIFWIFYVLNVVFSIIAYKLGFARKLPILKSVIVYVLLIVGTYITTIFSILKMPMTESLIIITIVLAIYRFRLYRERERAN